MILRFNSSSKEKPPCPAPRGVSFSAALPVHLPSTNSSFFHGASPAWSGAICARAGRTQNYAIPRITVVRIVISFCADPRIVPEGRRDQELSAAAMCLRPREATLVQTASFRQTARKLGVSRVMRKHLIRGDENRECDWRSISRRQTGYSQPIPKAGIGGSPRFATAGGTRASRADQGSAPPGSPAVSQPCQHRDRGSDCSFAASLRWRRRIDSSEMV